MKRCFVLSLLGALSLAASAPAASPPERITVVGNEFRVCNGGTRIWMAGGNTPWFLWNDFGNASFDINTWSSHYQTLYDNKINSSRVWITCSGEVGINISAAGLVGTGTAGSGATAKHWADLDAFFAMAQSKKIYVKATLMSFDHFKSSYTTYTRWRNWINSSSNVDSYISTYLTEFLNRYGSNPYLWSIDLCNEPEWASATENTGDPAQYGGIAWSRFQYAWGKMAHAIHDWNAAHGGDGPLVSVGMGFVKYLGPRVGAVNEVSDAILTGAAAGNAANAKLDFWDAHYYLWQAATVGNPFTQTPNAFFGTTLDRPAMLGECPNKGGSDADPPSSTDGPRTLKNDIDDAYANGWQGMAPWTTNNAGSGGFGDWDSDLNDATIPFNTAHPGLLFPSCGPVASVNAATTNQFIRGFGASSAWNSQAVLAPAAATLFADDNLDGHAGLSILRTRIDPNGAFANEAGPMTLAKAQNPNMIIWSTEWSPPAAYKNNNNVNGPGANNTFNNTPANSTAYANYLVNYIKTIKANYGIDLYAVSPQNEPDWNTSYESCVWTAAQFLDFVKNYLGPALSANSLATKIMIPESFSDNLAMAAATMNDAVAAPMVSIIGNHLYGGGPRTLASGGWSHLTTQESWETEMSDVSGAPHDSGMASALQIAAWVHSCMVTASMNAYLHWWIYAYGGSNEGLYGVDTTTPTKKLYALGNWSKFVRPGWYRLGGTIASGNTGVSLSAYKDNAGAPNRWAIVAINTNSSPVTQNFSLSGFSSTSCTPWVTDATRNLAHQASVPISGGSFSYTLPAQSVVSFVGGGPAGTPTPTPTYAGTSTRTPTPTPTPQSQLFDDFEDGDTTNNWGGTWSSYQGGGSTVALSVGAGGAPGSTAGSATATGTIADYGGVTGGFGTATRDLSAYVGISFMVKGSGSYWFQAPQSSIGDGDHFGATFNATGAWTLVTLYFSDFSQRGFGATATWDPGVIQSFQWASAANGAFNLQIDDVKVLSYSLPSPTPTASPTRTATRSATRTPTPSPSPTASPSASPSGTRTASPSPTASASPTQALASATASPTASPTLSGSPSASASPTRTASASATPSRTASPLASPTASPTATLSATASPVASATPSATVTLSLTPSPPASATPSATATSSPTPSPLASATPSATVSPSLTSSPAASATASTTATPSLPPSPMASVTPSATASPSLTRSPLPNASASPSATRTASPPPSPTPSASPSPTDVPASTATASPSVTATLSPGPAAVAEGPLLIETAVPWPNPNPRFLVAKLSGSAERVRVRFYTPAWTCVGQVESGPFAPGWRRIDLAGGLDNVQAGLLYFVVEAQAGGRVSPPVKGRLVRIR